MKKISECDYEQAVVKSLKLGLTNEEIAGHIESCANCLEAARIVRFFQANLAKDSTSRNLPAAGLVWWKTRLREKRRAAEEITKPIFYAQIIGAIIFAGVFIWLISSGALQSTSFASAIGRVFDSIGQIFVALISGIVGITVISVTLIFSLNRFWSEK